MTRMHASLLGLATLAALGLAAHPQTVHAQALTLGGTDTVTVSGAGTIGTIGGTQYKPGDDTTTSYNDSAVGVYYAVQTNDAAAFTLGTGGTLTVGEEDTGLDSEGSGSVVVGGGSISATGDFCGGVYEAGSGAVTVSGGVISASGQYSVGLNAEGSGAIAVNGGAISGSGYQGIGLETGGSGAFTVTGGTISGGGDDSFGLNAEGSGAGTVSGGTISAGQDGVGLEDGGSGAVTVSGGTINDADGVGLETFGSGAFIVTGGTFNVGSYTLIAGGGAIDLYGSFDGLTPGETRSLPSDPDNGAIGAFSGTLENDTDQQPQTFTYWNFSAITLHDGSYVATPEPSGFVGLGLGLLGLGALGMKARKRKA